MIYVKVPATCANLGAGFDSLGLALNMYNIVGVEQSDFCDIASLDGQEIPTDESNLVYQTVKKLYDTVGVPFTGLKLRQSNPIPQARGLGSSSACIVGGLVAGNALLGSPLSTEQLLDLACQIEGHPDNVAPALLGGFVVAAMENGHTYYVKSNLNAPIHYVALIPDFELQTAKARAALPQQYTRADAVFNLSRSALMAASMLSGNTQNIKVATQDKIHQPYRLDLIAGGAEIFKLGEELGALSTMISGAGPTILMMVGTDVQSFLAKLQERLLQSEQTAHFTPHLLSADNEGCRLCTVKE